MASLISSSFLLIEMLRLWWFGMWGLAEITGTLISKAILMIGSWSCSLTKFNEWVLDETECGDMLGMGSNFLLILSSGSSDALVTMETYSLMASLKFFYYSIFI